jgi:hypothetical protein
MRFQFPTGCFAPPPPPPPLLLLPPLMLVLLLLLTLIMLHYSIWSLSPAGFKAAPTYL